MTKDYLVTISIEGIAGTSTSIQVVDGTIVSQAAEDEFYALLRKSTRAMIENAESDERDAIINNLTEAQKEKLKEAHAKEYIGTDDDMPDDYDDWEGDLALEELKAALI